MYTLHHRIFVMRQSRVFPEPGHSATAHAISGRVIAVVHMSAPTASLYGNFNMYSSSSGVCGPSALREGWHPRRSWCPVCLLDAELLHHRLHFELSSRLSGKLLYRRLGVSKDVVHVQTHHRLRLSIIELTEYAWVRFWLLEPVVVEYVEQAPSRLYEPVDLVQQPHAPGNSCCSLETLSVYLLANTRLQECLLCIKVAQLSVFGRCRRQAYPDSRCRCGG